MIIKQNFDLTFYNSYRLQASCAKVCFPENEEDLISIYSQNESIIILGAGNNVILSRPLYDQTFVIFNEHFSSVSIRENRISAKSGASMLLLSLYALENSMTGLEPFYDIPSSFGGAIVMNAGAGNKEIGNVLKKVRFFNPGKITIEELTQKEIFFEYRNSLFQKNPELIILEGEMELEKRDMEEIKTEMEKIKTTRWTKQPKDFPNCGSVFKRPQGRFVGPMIENLGLKGFGVGGAKISTKHAGFIVNYNNATGTDILNTIEFIKEKIFKEYGVELEVEQRII